MTASILFKGLSAFPPTPTDAQGQVQEKPLAAILSCLQAAGVHSVGLLGSTGGYAYLSRDLRRRAVEIAAHTLRGSIPLIVGVGALRTDEAQALAGDAAAAGADGLLLAPMSYTPLLEEEVYEHFAAVAVATDLPLCIYNNPTTTKFVFSADLLSRLSRITNIVAVKMPLPADGGLVQELDTLRAIVEPDFAIGYSGDWGGCDALLAGADAWFSVVAGLLPAQALALTRAAVAGDAQEARRLDAAFHGLWSLFKEYGSFRVTYAIAELLGLFHAAPPRPILPLSPAVVDRVQKALPQLDANR